MSRQEQSSSSHAIPAIDSAKGEECNDVVHGCGTALLMDEKDYERAKAIAARGR
jgi:hypothetical protein